MGQVAFQLPLSAQLHVHILIFQINFTYLTHLETLKDRTKMTGINSSLCDFGINTDAVDMN